MDADVTSVTVLDRHSGTTGRAHLALTGHPSVPPTVFVKLAPFDAEQRKFVNVQGMGVAEARLYRDLAHELPVRVPKAWYAEFEGTGHRRRRPLRDGARRPRRVGLPLPDRDDADIEARIFDIVENLARAARAVLGEPALRARRRPRVDRAPRHRPAATAARRWCRWRSTTSPTGSPTASSPLAETYVEHAPEVLRAVPRGRVHARARRSAPRQPLRRRRRPDAHRLPRLGGGQPRARHPRRRVRALRVDADRAPARARAARCIARYREVLAEHGITLDADLAWEQYRLFTIYGWCCGDVHRGDGLQVAARAHRPRRHRTRRRSRRSTSTASA